MVNAIKIFDFFYLEYLLSLESYVPINFNPSGWRGGGGGELDNFQKSLTNSPPIGKTLCPKSIRWAIKFVI